jgi:hypothetical protein
MFNRMILSSVTPFVFGTEAIQEESSGESKAEIGKGAGTAGLHQAREIARSYRG